jgi:hypothetical protein
MPQQPTPQHAPEETSAGTIGDRHDRAPPAYVETTLSAAATFSANTFGVTNCAFFPLRSSSVTPRATEHLPQT